MFINILYKNRAFMLLCGPCESNPKLQFSALFLVRLVLIASHASVADQSLISVLLETRLLTQKERGSTQAQHAQASQR
uniref:Uncharacterized protein n=1 Tax=Physcomitrium patens TaxID=3218 RepID=A0A2K1KT75_PHYPA|nr:hypothetical protein PHYPA_003975 [Physcomitrium patens]